MNRPHGQSPTIAQATAALATLLVSARDIDSLTVDALARSYRVAPRRITEMLEAERRRRACA